MTKLYTFKSVFLAGMIVLGLCFQAKDTKAADFETLTVAGGCFWCVEADFERVNGVKEAVSGFMGGSVENPSYKQVVKGGTGHYEVVQITFDPSVVSRDSILSMFFRSVDPTDAGGQFCDRGETYRTAILLRPTCKDWRPRELRRTPSALWVKPSSHPFLMLANSTRPRNITRITTRAPS